MWIPINIVISDANLDSVRKQFVSIVPTWSAFVIAGCGKYLGIFVGPTSGAFQWLKQIQKWSSRACAIAYGGASMNVRCELYATRALTTLSYVAQLFPIPSSVYFRERGLLARLWHLPGQAFGGDQFFHLHNWGCYAFTPIKSYTSAIAMRTARFSLIGVCRRAI